MVFLELTCLPFLEPTYFAGHYSATVAVYNQDCIVSLSCKIYSTHLQNFAFLFSNTKANAQKSNKKEISGVLMIENVTRVHKTSCSIISRVTLRNQSAKQSALTVNGEKTPSLLVFQFIKVLVNQLLFW